MQIQLQFAERGEMALRVQAWLDEHVPHLAGGAWADPGLQVSLEMAPAELDGDRSWHTRLVAATSPLDVALELIEACLCELAVAPTGLVSVHLTGG